jgi:hypothetical protein
MKNNKTPTRQKVLEAFTVCAFGLSCWCAVLLFIEVAPKSHADRDTLRLVYTLGYFTAAIALCFHAQTGIPRFLWTVYLWRFEDAPPEIEKAVKDLVEECEFILLSFTWIWVVLLASTGLTVLNVWFAFPAIIVGITNLAWWGSLLALVLFVYWVPSSVDKMFKHYRFLRRQAHTSDSYRPRPTSDLWKLTPTESDRSVLPVSPQDGFTIGTRAWRLPKLTENLLVFGSIGSGKTVCVMNAFLENLIAFKGGKAPLGGLILDYKGEYYAKTLHLCQRHGRLDDLIVLSPESKDAWNPLDSNDEKGSEIAARFVATMKALGQKDHHTSFFADQAESLLQNAIELLRHSRPGSPPTIADVYRIANDFAFLQSRLEMLPALEGEVQLSDPRQRCQYFFANEYFSLPEEVRQSVVATLNNMLNPLCTAQIASIVDRASTVDLADATTRSKILYLHLPSACVPKAGRVMGMLLKLAFYAQVKKKTLGSGQFCFFFADEFQEFFTTDDVASDTRFFSVSRAFDHINIVATQNMNNLTMLGEKKDAVLSFLASAKSKVFLQNSDNDTNEYASELFGKYVAELGGTHYGAVGTLLPRVTPSDFIRLRTPENGVCDYCESFILEESASKVDVADRTARWPVHPL